MPPRRLALPPARTAPITPAASRRASIRQTTAAVRRGPSTRARGRGSVLLAWPARPRRRPRPRRRSRQQGRWVTDAHGSVGGAARREHGLQAAALPPGRVRLRRTGRRVPAPRGLQHRAPRADLRGRRALPRQLRRRLPGARSRAACATSRASASSRCSTSTRTSTTSASRARAGPTGRCRTTGCRPSRKAGFPANYTVMPALNRAFDHFWANDPGPGGVGLQDRYAAAWRHVAAALPRRALHDGLRPDERALARHATGRRAPTRPAARSSTRGPLTPFSRRVAGAHPRGRLAATSSGTSRT